MVEISLLWTVRLTVACLKLGKGRRGVLHYNGLTAWEICFSQSYQYGIFALVSQMSFCRKTIGGVATTSFPGFSPTCPLAP